VRNKWLGPEGNPRSLQSRWAAITRVSSGEFLPPDSSSERRATKRLAGRPPADVGACLAQAQPRTYSFPDRLLVFDLFCLRHSGGLRDSCRLGSRERHHAAGGRNSAWEYPARGCHQRRGIFLRADRDHLVRAHPVGAFARKRWGLCAWRWKGCPQFKERNDVSGFRWVRALCACLQIRQTIPVLCARPRSPLQHRRREWVQGRHARSRHPPATVRKGLHRCDRRQPQK
jgi:hypothetical protein